MAFWGLVPLVGEDGVELDVVGALAERRRKQRCCWISLVLAYLVRGVVDPGLGGARGRGGVEDEIESSIVMGDND